MYVTNFCIVFVTGFLTSFSGRQLPSSRNALRFFCDICFINESVWSICSVALSALVVSVDGGYSVNSLTLAHH